MTLTEIILDSCIDDIHRITDRIRNLARIDSIDKNKGKALNALAVLIEIAIIQCKHICEDGNNDNDQQNDTEGNNKNCD